MKREKPKRKNEKETENRKKRNIKNEKKDKKENRKRKKNIKTKKKNKGKGGNRKIGWEPSRRFPKPEKPAGNHLEDSQNRIRFNV